MGVVEADTRTLERELTGALGMWAAGSVISGVGLTVLGQVTEQSWLSSFARQQVAWGAVDGAIAGFGAWRQRGQGPSGVAIVDDSDRPSPDAMKKAERLHTLLRVNTALDVGYVAAGAATIAAAARLGERFGRSKAEVVGTGAGVVVQGGFLLVLDAFFAYRVGRFIDEMRASGASGTAS